MPYIRTCPSVSCSVERASPLSADLLTGTSAGAGGLLGYCTASPLAGSAVAAVVVVAVVAVVAVAVVVAVLLLELAEV